MIGNVEKTKAQSTRFVAKTSDVRNLSENIRSDVKKSEVATLFMMAGRLESSLCFPNCVPLKRLKCAANVLCFDKTFCMLHHFRYKVCEDRFL